MRPDPYSWTAHPEAALAVAVLVVWYVVAVRGTRVARWRIACFAGAAALLLATAVTPLEALTFHRLSMHLLQNVILAEWAPALLVLGVPTALAERLSRPTICRALTRPWVALPLWLANYFLWHVPIAYDTALRHPHTLLHVEHAMYLATGLLVWWPALQDVPWRLPAGARAGYLFAAFVLASPLGLLLALIPSSIYDYYDDSRLWGLSPLTDQQIAGIAMASAEAIVFFAAFVYWFARFLREEETPTRVEG